MTFLRSLRFTFVATGFLLFAPSIARAQQPEPQPQPPVAAPAAPAPPAAPAEEEEKARFRWGISGLGGVLPWGGDSTGAGGVDARLGAQINNMIGVYGQPFLVIAAGQSVNTGTGAVSQDAVVAAGVEALVDFTFADVAYVAVGPGYVSAAGGRQAVNVGGVSQGAYAGSYFDVALRGGLALGSMKPNRRKAFTIGLDARMIFTPDEPTIVPMLALGYDAF
jgi:hypothetical protein